MSGRPRARLFAPTLGRALRHRNYRLFFAGQTTSLIGTWITRVATSWLVYRLTGSTLALGVVGFAGQIPTFVVAPFAGVWVDRWNKHRVLVLTQALALLQSAALAALALTGTITVAWVVVLGIVQGLVNAFDIPARQSFVVEMVNDREDLPNAIALNSSMVNAARLLGPSIAGVLIAAVGEGWCFAVDAASYLAVIASLLAMRVSVVEKPPKNTHLLTELSEGFKYAAGFVPIRNVLLLLALVSFMGMPYTVLMPVIATRVLSGGAHTLGFLMAASGLGALLGTLYLASRKTVLGLGRLIAFAAAVFGTGLVAFSHSREFWLSFALLVPTGAGMMIQMAGSNTILQTLVDDDKRGRVMSFFAMAFFGTVPFGSLFGGTMAARFGAQNTILVGGVSCIVGAAMFLRALPELRRLARPTYIRLGILSDVPDE
ncbi:MAG TPA: MFS transporter [Polyangiaceae bacterium]|jgi:MFS family permease|nr:MFS transporter [Polyangiaceae bacterium]